jgi:hypothetical protein
MNRAGSGEIRLPWGPPTRRPGPDKLNASTPEENCSMTADRPTLPPVRLRPLAELARDALAAPLFTRAVVLARWAGQAEGKGIGVGPVGELLEASLPAAAARLGLGADPQGAGEVSQAWRLAVGIGLVDVEEGGEGDDEEAVARPGAELSPLASGSPQDVLDVWRAEFEEVFSDAAQPDLEGLVNALGAADDIDLDALGWDPDGAADFLDGVLGNLYQLTVTQGGGASEGPVPLPVLAASMIVPEGTGEPSNAVLEQVSDAMVRLDDQFRLLEPIGLVEYRPVDEALLTEAEAEAETEHVFSAGDEDITRYGMVRLTPLGLYGVRARLLEAGAHAPAVGDLADKGADVLLDAVAAFPEPAGRAEIEQWLACREGPAAAGELLAAARGGDPGAPQRRLACQQALALIGATAEPAVREVLGDPELGGLARVWLAERGVADVPPPSADMIFWLTIDTIAAQLGHEGDSEELRQLVESLIGQDGGFLDAAWRVGHPATADVLEAMGRLHRDKRVAKEARKAGYKARSRRAG